MIEVTNIYEEDSDDPKIEVLMDKKTLAVIYFLSGEVGGDGDRTWRHEIDDIFNALSSAGVFDDKFHDDNDRDERMDLSLGFIQARGTLEVK